MFRTVGWVFQSMYISKCLLCVQQHLLCYTSMPKVCTAQLLETFSDVLEDWNLKENHQSK